MPAALIAGVVGLAIGVFLAPMIWSSDSCTSPSSYGSHCIRDIAKLEAKYPNFVMMNNQNYGFGGSQNIPPQQPSSSSSGGSWWPWSWGGGSQNAAGTQAPITPGSQQGGFGPPNGAPQSPNGNQDTDYLVWERLLWDIASYQGTPRAPCGEFAFLFSKQYCAQIPSMAPPLSHPPMPPEMLSKLRAQAWRNDDFWAEVELGWRYYHGDDNHTEDNRDIVEAYVWDFLASVNSRVSADDTPPYVASTIVNERGRITQDLSEISNVLNAEQRDDVRNRIAYVLACRGPIGYAELGNIYAPSWSGGGAPPPQSGGGPMPLITPTSASSYSPGTSPTSLLEANDHDALMFYKRADIKAGHALPVYAQYTANYEQEIRQRHPNPDAIIRSAEQDAQSWRPAFNAYPRGHAKSGIPLTDECGDWRTPQDSSSDAANCDNGYQPGGGGTPQTPPDAPTNYAPTSVPNGPDSNRDAAQYWAGVSRCYLKAGDSRLAVADVGGAKVLWGQAISVGQQYGSEASISAQRRLGMYTSACRPTDETLKAISWDFADQHGELISVLAIQQALQALGFYEGRLDDRLSQDTRNGIRNFQRAMEFDETETLTPLQTVYLICNAATQSNDSGSKNTLGIMYAIGLGVVQNTDLGLNWLQQSARQHNAEAAYNLAILYGSGTTQNSYRLCDIAMSAEMADSYLIQAANGRLPRAMDIYRKYFGKKFTARQRWDRIDAELQKDPVYAHRLKMLGKKCAPEAPPLQQ